MKSNFFDGTVVNGVRQPILLSFVFYKQSGCNVFRQPGTIHNIKINKSVLNTITFYLENDWHKEVSFNGETLTFTLQLIKVWTNKWAFKNLEVIFFCFGGRHISATKIICGDITSNVDKVLFG